MCWCWGILRKLLYIILNNLFETFYSLKSTTLSDKDPYLVNPEIKSLLRLKNKLMREGRLEKADALSRRIGERITRCNAAYFSSKQLTSRELWSHVGKVMGKAPSRHAVGSSTMTASLLNAHYAKVWTDAQYIPPPLKLTVTTQIETFTEFDIFRILDQGCPTSAGYDGMPAWFLRLAAPAISLPLSYL